METAGYLAEYVRRLAARWLLLLLLLVDLVGLGAIQVPALRDVAVLQPYLVLTAFAIVLIASFDVFREERKVRALRERRISPRFTKIRHGVGMAEARPDAHGSAGWDYFVQVFIANKPPAPDPSALAERVSASLYIYQRGTRNLLLERDPLPIRSGEDVDEVPEVDMPPTGRPFRIDVLRKGIRERDCYFWDSRFRTVTFGPGEYDLLLNIRGIGAASEFTFVLRNPESDDPPELEFIGEHVIA